MRSVASREACGVVKRPAREGGEQGVPSPRFQGEGHGSGVEPGSAAVKDSPAYGARNVSMVAAGTGEALPGPVTRGAWCRWSVAPYNRFTPGNGWRAGWASEAAVVLIEPSGQQNRW